MTTQGFGGKLQERLDFVLEGQSHCDYYLGPLTDPSGKSVLVAGCGAGTEMLWCLRRGAREVVGIDVLEQDPSALLEARSRFEIDPAAKVEIRRLDVLDVGTLRRRFDLVLSNNVFEHIADVEGALRACLGVVDPEWGRVAIFSAPLYYSSSGSHLEHEPWEHLWGEPSVLQTRLLGRAGRAPRALRLMTLEEYLFGEITLNRLRFREFVEALSRLDAVIFKLAALPDRSIHRFGEFEARIRDRLGRSFSSLDLTIEGLLAEIGPSSSSQPIHARLSAVSRSGPVAEAPPPPPPPATKSLAPTYRELEAELARERARAIVLQAQADEFLSLIRSIEVSPTFRIARFFTSRLRGLRRRART